jgi:dihydroorotate dehydrogenase (NAD+) catalytic subunit
MKVEKKQLGNKKVMPFTIPSGIVTTDVSCLERIANEIPEIGILTTKSIGPGPRAGNREPILAQYYPGCFVNAVGLTNPGADEFAKKLSSIKIPEDKFLLASIFGKDTPEFVDVAEKLEPYVDGFELNLSCPHASGYGMQLGQDPMIVYPITNAVCKTTKKPVFAKLTPNAKNIGEIAEAAMRAGAYGLVAINTAGPGAHMIDDNYVLTNKVGGLSGRGITPIGMKCVKDIAEKLGNVPIIGMGGIATADDVRAYAKAGASFFGIGSALAGMTESEMKKYFSTLARDLNEGTNNAKDLLKEVDMEYRKVKIDKKIDAACNFKLIKTDDWVFAEPGQFVYAWIPGFGEKPFSIMDDNGLTLGILEKGEFTKKINSLQEGDSFYVRGPYGNPVELPQNNSETCVLVGGGCGSAGIYMLAKRLKHRGNNVITLLGAKDKEHIAFLDEFKKCGKVLVATEDGSLGEKGLVSDLFKTINLPSNIYFYNCGPKAMVDAILPFELSISQPERVYSSLDYMTKCGVGICGSCADEKGRLPCVEGPFMKAQ